MNAKHTKGPWTAIDNSWEVSTVNAPDGTNVAQVMIHADVTEESQEKFEAIKDANARLIAAAPDMYEALLSTRASLQAMADEGLVAHGSWPTIEAALAKANGEDAS